MTITRRKHLRHHWSNGANPILHLQATGSLQPSVLCHDFNEDCSYNVWDNKPATCDTLYWPMTQATVILQKLTTLSYPLPQQHCLQMDTRGLIGELWKGNYNWLTYLTWHCTEVHKCIESNLIKSVIHLFTNDQNKSFCATSTGDHYNNSRHCHC